jgi:hypothetical protein
MNYKKLLLNLIIFLLAFGTSLIPTYYYGKVKHDRYYNETILKVQLNQIKLMKETLNHFKNKDFLKRDININDIKTAFSPMSFYAIIKVKNNKNNKECIVFMHDYYDVREEVTETVNINDLTITFGTYMGTPWNTQFLGWLEMILPLKVQSLYKTDKQPIEKECKKTLNKRKISKLSWWNNPTKSFEKYDFITVAFLFFLAFSCIVWKLILELKTQNRYFKDILNTVEKLKRETVE